MKNIEERIGALEKSAKRYRTGFYVVLLLFAATVLMGQTATAPTGDVVRCRGLVVEDAQGKARAILQVTQEGVGLFMYDMKEKLNIKLGMLDTGTGLVLYDPFGTERTIVDIYKSKSRFSMLDSNGTRRIGMAIAEDGQGMTLYDSRGVSRATLDGEGIVFKDKRKVMRSSLDVRGLGVADSFGKTRAILKILDDGPSLRFYDSDEKEISRSP